MAFIQKLLCSMSEPNFLFKKENRYVKVKKYALVWR